MGGQCQLCIVLLSNLALQTDRSGASAERSVSRTSCQIIVIFTGPAKDGSACRSLVSAYSCELKKLNYQ